MPITVVHMHTTTSRGTPTVHRRHRAPLAAGALLLSSLALAIPAGAADTTVNLTLIETGGLSITAPTAVAGEAGTTSASGALTSIQIDGITVTDSRTTKGTFTVSAHASDLTRAGGALAVDNEQLQWVTEEARKGILPTTDLNFGNGALGSPIAIATKKQSAALMDGTYVIDGRIDIPIGGLAAGSYSTVVTTSVS